MHGAHHHGKILLADADERYLRSTTRQLRQQGHSVKLTPRRREALRLLEHERFDLLVTDLRLDGDPWIQTLLGARARALGAAGSWPAIIVVTADPTFESAIEALRASVFDYRLKPLNFEHFERSVAAAIAKSRRLEQVRAARREASRCLERIHALERELALELDPALAPTRSAAPRATLDQRLSPLTPREREVLEHFAAFPRVREIATRLDISPHTVRSHLKAVYRKLEVSSQTELLRLLASRGDEPRR